MMHVFIRREKKPVTAAWLTFHPVPCTPDVGSPAVSPPPHARTPTNSLDYIYHSRSRIHEYTNTIIHDAALALTLVLPLRLFRRAGL